MRNGWFADILIFKNTDSTSVMESLSPGYTTHIINLHREYKEQRIIENPYEHAEISQEVYDLLEEG